jgi:uncharacterized membrane protein YfcA
VTGGLIGVPIGAALVTYVDQNYVRTGVGVLLIVYSAYSLARPHLKARDPGFAADAGIGVINGVLGGMTGLAGPVITMWCNFRGFRKDVQRAIYQPVILAAFVLTAISLAIAGVVTADLIRIYLYGLPTLAVGLWVGLKLYGHLNEETFRKVILVLLLFSGLALVVPFR